MSVEILDGTTIRNFLEDETTFDDLVRDRFAVLVTNYCDGLLSFAEMAKELKSLSVIETHFDVEGTGLGPEELVGLYRGMFARFVHDGSGDVDVEEFRTEMKEVMLAVANGLGFLPVQMVVEEGSFIKRAVERKQMTGSIIRD